MGYDCSLIKVDWLAAYEWLALYWSFQKHDIDVQRWRTLSALTQLAMSRVVFSFKATDISDHRVKHIAFKSYSHSRLRGFQNPKICNIYKKL